MTDFKIKMAELAKKYNISHKRDIDWHNFVYEVQQLKEDELKNVYDLKILPEYFRAVKSGEKTFEVRLYDRPFEKGEILHLCEWNGSDYTGESIYVEVTYILDNPDYCKEGYVIMAIRKMEQKPVEWSEVELEFRGEKVKVKRPFFRDDNGRGYSTTEQDEEVSWNALRAWCEKKGISLYDLYPKVEWSEEDEKMLQRIIRHTESEYHDWCNDKYGNSEIISDGKRSCLERLSWLEKHLKSLRPQSKEERSDYITPNKEFFQWIYDRLVNVHKENPDVDYMRSFKKRIDNLDFGGQPRWKPSEEQMKALLNAEGYLREGDQFDSAKSIAQLYEQLKKL